MACWYCGLVPSMNASGPTTGGVLSTVTVVVVDWGGLGVVKRVAFGGLSVLGVVLLVRSALALRLDRVRGPGWAARFLGHIGFVLISLFDGFCIVTAIDLHLPIWAIIAAAVLGVAAGVVATKAATRRVARTTDALAGGAA